MENTGGARSTDIRGNMDKVSRLLTQMAVVKHNERKARSGKLDKLREAFEYLARMEAAN
jgi:hypothetical protein